MFEIKNTYENTYNMGKVKTAYNIQNRHKLSHLELYMGLNTN